MTNLELIDLGKAQYGPAELNTLQMWLQPLYPYLETLYWLLWLGALATVAWLLIIRPHFKK